MKAWRAPKADYTFSVGTDGSVHIVDLNLGNMSVTNDAENVLAAIHKEVNLSGRSITYEDSEGQIDYLEHKDGEFLKFAPGPRKELTD